MIEINVHSATFNVQCSIDGPGWLQLWRAIKSMITMVRAPV
jgi:hypothetical protein